MSIFMKLLLIVNKTSQKKKKSFFHFYFTLKNNKSQKYSIRARFTFYILKDILLLKKDVFTEK